MSQPNDSNKSVTPLEQDTTMIAVIEMGLPLAQWYRARTADARGGTRKTLIVALARKLLIALWRMVTTGEIPEGISLRPAVA